MSSNITPWILVGATEAASTEAAANSAAAQDITTAISIPAGVLADGSVIHARCVGHVTTADNYTLLFSTEIGGTAVTSTTATSTGGAISAEAVTIDAYGVVRTTGATGTILWAMTVNADTAAIHQGSCETTATTTVMTAAVELNFSVTFGTASTSNTFTAQQVYLELLGS